MSLLGAGYRPGADVTTLWSKHAVDQGVFAEGVSIGDLDGDGRLDLVHGPYVYLQPKNGPCAGPWKRTVFAPNFREMCRTALADVTGRGRLDIVIAESEYMDGRFSWFENRLREDPACPWVEHELGRGFVYAHSFRGWLDSHSGNPRIFVAEMAAGGWDAPRNWDARVLLFSTENRGETWQRELIYQGAGTHEATILDLDGDGQLEVIGKQWQIPYIQLWKRPSRPSPLTRVQHRLLDRDKPYTATDILAADINGDGLQDVVCGSWWYQNPGVPPPSTSGPSPSPSALPSPGSSPSSPSGPSLSAGGPIPPSWKMHSIRGIYQVHTAHDLDGDGRVELIATKPRPGAQVGYDSLCSELCWLKPIAPEQGEWEEHPIGSGRGDWPHSTLVAPLLPGGRLALVAGYHSAAQGDYPELFEVPDDPRVSPWPKRTLAEIPYGEEIVAFDLTGDGRLDLVAGPYWLENLGDGRFGPHRITDEQIDIARVRVADVNDDGRPEVVFVEERLDYSTRTTYFARVGWFAPPDDIRSGPWTLHVVDQVRSPHSLDVADLDGDGQLEIICGEHDPFWPYRTRCRLLVYHRADPSGRAWTRHVLDDRFEHHDGTKAFEVAPGRLAIMSHGWTDSIYVHLWELP